MFEKDPSEAATLLKFTYVIEEEFIITECRMWGKRNRDKILQRLANIVTFGLMFREEAWKAREDSKFDVNRLRLLSGNYETVKKQEHDLITASNMRAREEGHITDADGNEVTDKKDIENIVLQMIANRDKNDTEMKIHFDEEEAKRKEEQANTGWFVWLLDVVAGWLYYQMYGIVHAFAISIMSKVCALQ